MNKEKKELDNDVSTKFVDSPSGFNGINTSDDNLMKSVARCYEPVISRLNLDYSFIN